MKIKNIKLGSIDYSKKERFIMAALTSCVLSFIYILFGTVDIYANNKDEFPFVFYDFIWVAAAIFVAVAAIMTLLIYFFKSNAVNVVTAMLMSVVVSGYIDSTLINKITFTSGDVSGLNNSQFWASVAVYVVMLYVFSISSLLLKKKWKSVLIFLSVLFLGMNGASLVSDIVTKDLLSDDSINCDYVISNKNINCVSQKENIIYILVDRLDVEYCDYVEKNNKEFFDDMQGFTYYNKATSVYTRTFPGVPYLISGTEYTAQCSAKEYLDTAYSKSKFLTDIKKNGYNINLYIDRYYEYNDAKTLLNVADNVQKVTSYKPDVPAIIKYLTKYSVSRNFSYMLTMAAYSNANSGSVATLSTLGCKDGMYHDDDLKTFKMLNEKGLTYTNTDKNYTFLYLHGCHTPYILDENCQLTDNGNVITQTMGTFQVVFKYLDELKRLGVYDNSTIIISGDHPNPTWETKYYTDALDSGRYTGLFVKPRHSDNKKLIRSSAQVSGEHVFATMIQDAGIQTAEDYGKSVFDIKEDDTVTRTFYQSVYSSKNRKLNYNQYEISGDAKDFKNWKHIKRITSDVSWY